MAEIHRQDPDAHRAYQRDRAQRLRAEFSAWLDSQKTPCRDCGERDPAFLVFHHRDPETKRFEVQHNAWSRKRADVEEEMSRCDVLCRSCHLRHHWRTTRRYVA